MGKSSPPCRHWMLRMPAELVALSTQILSCLVDVYYVTTAMRVPDNLRLKNRADGLESNDSSNHITSAVDVVDKSGWEMIDCAFTDLEKSIPIADRMFSALEERFGVVADGPCGSGLWLGTSWHAWVLKMSTRFNEKAGRTFRSDDFAGLLAVVRKFDVKTEDLLEYIVRLEQELFRVWARFYHGQPYRTLNDLPKNESNSICTVWRNAERGFQRSRRRRRIDAAPKRLTTKQAEAVQAYADLNGDIPKAAKRCGISPKSMRNRLAGAWKKIPKQAATNTIKAKISRLLTDRRGQENLSSDDDRRRGYRG
jgi:hypothetical protein